MKRRNKRRLLSLMLCVVMISCMFPANASAYSEALLAKYGDYIDLDELETDFQIEAGVRLSIGGLPFWGKLQRGAELTDQQIDGALQRALNQCEINLTDLAAFEAATKLADEYKEGWTAEKVLKSAFKIFGADEVNDVWDAVTGKLDDKAAQEKWLKGKFLDEVKKELVSYAVKDRMPLLVGKLGLKTAGFTVSCLANAGDIAIKELVSWLSSSKVLSEGRKAAAELEEFYRIADKKLASDLNKIAGDWEIEFDGATLTRPNMELFGIGGIPQTYTVNGLLTRKKGSRATAHENPELTDISGTYTGRLEVKVTHNLYNFDQELIMLYIETPFYQGMAGSGYQFMSMNLFPSKLDRWVIDEDFSVTVSAPQGGGSVSYIPIDFSGFRVVTDFKIGQDIAFAHTEATVAPDASADGKGDVSYHGYGASDYLMSAVFKSEDIGRRGIRLKQVGVYERGISKGYGWVSQEWDMGETGEENLVIGEDNQIFAELDMNSSLEVGWLVQKKE